MDHQPIVVTKVIDAPAGKVWTAITDKDQMKKWYFHIEDFQPEVGFEFSFEGGDDKKKYLHLCKITAVVPGQKITYSWRYENTENTYVTFELIPDGDRTTVKLTHEGVERIEKEEPAYARENFEAGWQQIIGVNLKDYLKGGE